MVLERIVGMIMGSVFYSDLTESLKRKVHFDVLLALIKRCGLSICSDNQDSEMLLQKVLGT